MAPITVQHVAGSTNTFKLFIDFETADAETCFTIPSPYEFAVESREGPNLMGELRWYLEHFLDYPLPPQTDRANQVMNALKTWANEALEALRSRPDVRERLQGFDCVRICSEDPKVLSWPWEAVCIPENDFAGHNRYVERSISNSRQSHSTIATSTERLNILLVIARPYDKDVGYLCIARALMELIQSTNPQATLHVLRPPTFDELRNHLSAFPRHYHILHFDGHGTYFDGAGSLVFEDQSGGPNTISAVALSNLLCEHAVPAVVLNACQSAMHTEEANDIFSSVATSLIRAGIRSVLAMAYSLNVSGAQVFLSAYYGHLLKTGQVGAAVSVGREAMFTNKTRICGYGKYPLNDWLVPVLYQLTPVRINFNFETHKPATTQMAILPQEAIVHLDHHRFVGFDDAIRNLERALRSRIPAILIRGLRGAGKTRLAREFLRWLSNTNGIENALWFDFQHLHTARQLFSRIGESIYGQTFAGDPNGLRSLTQSLVGGRFVLVWDNFQCAQAGFSSDDHFELNRFLNSLHGGNTTIIIISRSRLEWLHSNHYFDLPLMGFERDECMEYWELLRQQLNLTIDLDGLEFTRLLDELRGNPLSLRVVLPNLRRISASKLLDLLRTNLLAIACEDIAAQHEIISVFCSIDAGLADAVKPLLVLIGFHESFLNVMHLKMMALKAGLDHTRVEDFIRMLEFEGLVRGGNDYDFLDIHPLFASYLRTRQGTGSEFIQRAFVFVVSALGSATISDEAKAELKEVDFEVIFFFHQANFYAALKMAEQLGLNQEAIELTQALAFYAQKTKNLDIASSLLARMAQGMEVTGDLAGVSMLHHQRGTVAEEQGDLAAARKYCLKSLSISEKLGDSHAIALAHLELGKIADAQRDFETAEEEYLQALSLAERSMDFELTYKTLHQLGMTAENRGLFGAAEDLYLNSLAISEERYPEDTYATYHQLGNIALKADRDFAAALNWYYKSLEVAKSGERFHSVALTYIELGTLYQLLEELDEAESFYFEALLFLEKQGDNRAAAAVYHNLGAIAGKKGNLGLAREWLLKSLHISETCNQHLAAYTQGQMGTLAFMEGGVEEGGELLVGSISALLEMGDNSQVKKFTEVFVAFYRDFADSEKQALESIWHRSGLDWPCEGI